MRILVIDDDEQICDLLHTGLELSGFTVEVAENGRIGQRMYEEKPYDLIITDLIMPEQEGMETITNLKQNYPAIKIIAISGGGRIGPEAYLPDALLLGADLAFTKPFDLGKLIEAVRELLGMNGSSD